MIARVTPWLLVVALALGCAWLVRRAWNAEGEAAQAIEARELAAQDQIVGLRTTVEQLTKEQTTLTNHDAELQDALDAARKAASGAKVVRVVRASTGPMVVGGEPRECPVSASTQQCPTCLLAVGDSVEVRVNEIDIETKADNRVAVGTGECLRVSPPPETSLARGPFEAKLTTVSQLEEPRPASDPGLGLGVAAFASGKGTALGVAISPPPLRIWALQLDLTIAGGTGNGGPHGAATVIGRLVR